MEKKYLILIILGILLFSIFILFNNKPTEIYPLVVDGEGITTVNVTLLEWALKDSSELSSEEIDGLLFMYEEEKLARDVYNELFNYWNLPIFRNIASAEQTHMDAVRSLFSHYDIDTTIIYLEPGIYANSEIQDIYGELLINANSGTVAAFKAGALIEEKDIKDLEEYMSQTENKQIIQVYENLQKGSRNHLRSMNSQLEKRGESYEPVYLNSELYEEIITSSIERGSS